MDLFNVWRAFNMLNIGDVTPVLSINWLKLAGIITALITFIAFLWGIFLGFNKKVSKKTYYFDKDKRDTEIKELEKKMTATILDIDLKNQGSHAKLSDESHEYFQLLREDMAEERKNVAEKISLLIELVKKGGK